MTAHDRKVKVAVMSCTIAIVTGFNPVDQQTFCKCGHEVDCRALVRRPDGSAFLTCPECHSLLADLAVDIATLDPDDDVCPF